MTLARPSARRQAKEVDAKLRQPGRVAKFGPRPRAAGHIERRRVSVPTTGVNIVASIRFSMPLAPY
jgi:hypothetical protein